MATQQPEPKSNAKSLSKVKVTVKDHEGIQELLAVFKPNVPQ
jgi:hypothetical protein